MGTDQLLDLLQLSAEDDNSIQNQNKEKKSSKKKSGLQAVLDNLEDLWEKDQYEEEYSVENFIQKLD